MDTWSQNPNRPSDRPLAGHSLKKQGRGDRTPPPRLAGVTPVVSVTAGWTWTLPAEGRSTWAVPLERFGYKAVKAVQVQQPVGGTTTT